MECSWLAEKDRSSCLLFLAGWAMAPEPFQSIPAHTHDVLMVHDYRRVDASAVMERVQKYDTVHLLAWSMGVWIAGAFFDEYRDRFVSAVALNGTLQPIDDHCGLPPRAFARMIHDFSPAILEKFYRDMFDQPVQAERFFCSRPGRSRESILDELRMLQKMVFEHGPGKDLFRRRIVGTRDRIFTVRAQQRSWGKKQCERLQIPHFPFYDWSSWDQMMQEESIH